MSDPDRRDASRGRLSRLLNIPSSIHSRSSSQQPVPTGTTSAVNTPDNTPTRAPSPAVIGTNAPGTTPGLQGSVASASHQAQSYIIDHITASALPKGKFIVEITFIGDVSKRTKSKESKGGESRWNIEPYSL
ncbi:hypothetical protein CONPUDRAFT_170118 [Coniophora puteana RWD-64-598 SS2]|uniref:Uncharacterized protein n=1 Tax=Coniophora puteana (strain RWD-64-598) TaxID=741705 RepID=R7SDZ2_CONPW|nr:uncharacterized protein CONPUDRAFT_170118 [Coniophora puteana RWD-64-598 SS2]EIW74388.1 hypothetical protein CONPUDRAFT_170118 [Coniophora puteana RWD-64-598 SS2]